MTAILQRWATGLGVTVLVGLLGAAAPVPAADPADTFGLEPPVIIKADRDTTLVQSGDINGDGLRDFVAVNNRKGLLQTFLQRRQGDVISFEKHEEALDQGVSDLLVCDCNGDGKDDLLMASADKRLQVRLQQKDGTLGASVPLQADGTILTRIDVDGDGVPDIVALRPEKTVILFGDAKTGFLDAKPVEFFNAGSPANYRPIVCDLDGNGLSDIAYLDSQRRSRLLVRFQTAKREWGLETGFEMAEASDLVGLPGLAGGKGPEAAGGIAVVDARTRELRYYRLTRTAGPQERFPLAGPYFLSFDPRSQSGRECLLACDVEGQGRMSLLAASPRAAEISLYVQNKQGGLDTSTAASLVDIAALAAIPRPGGGALVLSLSGQEETIGASVWEAGRGLSVPQFLDSGRKPLAMAVGDFDGDGKDDLVYLFKDEKEGLGLALIGDPTEPAALRTQPRILPLPAGLDFDPVAMMAADVNGDKRCDLLIFSRYNPLCLLLQGEGQTFTTFATDQGMKKGIFNKIGPAQVTVADIDGDGKNEIVLARDNFARAYRIGAGGELTLVDQFNGRDVSSRIGSTAVADLDGDGKPEVVLLDTANQLLTIYARNAKGDFELVRHHDASGLRGARLLAADLNGDKRADLVVYEGDRMHLFQSGQPLQRLETTWRQTPEEKEGKYSDVGAEPLLAGAPSQQLLAVEETEHVLEFYEADPAKPEAMRRFFRFKVFDDESSMGGGASEPGSPGARSRAEPRASMTVDVDGDGLPDLVLLAHDNILYYRQFKVQPKKKPE